LSPRLSIVEAKEPDYMLPISLGERNWESPQESPFGIPEPLFPTDIQAFGVLLVFDGALEYIL